MGQRVISLDCNEYYSKYAADNPEREGMAESFVAYFALRFRRERLTQQQISDIISIGPNRLKFFYDKVDEATSRPPVVAPMLLMSSRNQSDAASWVRRLPTADSEPSRTLTTEELEQL